MKIRWSSSQEWEDLISEMMSTKKMSDPDALWNIFGLSDVLKCLLWVKGIQYSSYLGFITSENDRLLRAQRAGPLSLIGTALTNIIENSATNYEWGSPSYSTWWGFLHTVLWRDVDGMVADGTDESEFDESESDHNPIPNPEYECWGQKRGLEVQHPNLRIRSLEVTSCVPVK